MGRVAAPRTEFRALRQVLVRDGVAPAIVARMLAELHDHHEDLQAEAMASGSTAAAASAEAMERLGSRAVLAEAVARHPELRSWAFRWPWVPVVLRPVAVASSLASVPVLIVVSRGAVILRWCVSTGLAMLVTGGLLLLLARLLIGRPLP